MGQVKRLYHPDTPGVNASVDRILTALADPHRRRAVELLGKMPHRAGELASALDLPAPALSRHLRLLKECGLVEESHPAFDARVRIYALKDGAMTDLKNWLASTEAMWTVQLSALKAHVEQKNR
jgi:DNA-binding transcriptional ArsR family regulator